MTTFTGILRDSKFSPNSNDTAIMRTVSMELIHMGCKSTLVPESQLLPQAPPALSIFTMARSEKALDLLSRWQREKSIYIINPPQGVRNCNRLRLVNLLRQASIPMPPTLPMCADAPLPRSLTYPCWLKRADAAAQSPEDVAFIADKGQLFQHLQLMQQKGVNQFVISRHTEGDLVKFYGVAGTSFFYWYYPTLQSIPHSKFGLESHNTPIRQIPFSADTLHHIATLCAQVTHCPVYGGDCIVDSKGDIYVIDFNDWPSFSPCIPEASRAIANLLMQNIPHS